MHFSNGKAEGPLLKVSQVCVAKDSDDDDDDEVEN
jgi:hypothetical protein